MLLWDVDTQVDFLHPEGRLYVPGAEQILPNLHRLTQWARDRRLPVISSACAHQPGDPELQQYGPHCMVGTPGQQKVAETLLSNRLVVPNRPLELPDLSGFQQIIIEKQTFDVFSNPNTDQVVRQFGATLDLVMYGVVTEICVASAARSLLDRGYRVTLVTDAVQSLDSEKAKLFLDDFLARGGQVVNTDSVVAAR